MEILANGSLIVQGGDENESTSGEGGGAGGIIQIISPVGNLSANSLSLEHGTNNGRFNCEHYEEYFDYHGYYYLQGIST